MPMVEDPAHRPPSRYVAVNLVCAMLSHTSYAHRSRKLLDTAGGGEEARSHGR